LEAVALKHGPPDAGTDDGVDTLRALFEQTPAVLLGNAFAIGLIALAFWPLAPWAHSAGWSIVALSLWTVRLAHWQRYRSRRDADAATLLAWRRGWRVLVLLQGAMWPIAVWTFWNLGSPFHTVALVLLGVSYSFASVQLLAPQPALFTAFTSIVLLPIVVRVASDSAQPWHWQLALVLVLLFAITLVMGRTYRDALAQAIGLKQQTEHLAAQLRREKAGAEEARRTAETANRAKTQFFAAASHDLRQPLHAMGLFAEALRQRSEKSGDPEVASLVNSINQSVDALEGLFSELLDITRIDSGGVEVQAQGFEMADILRKIRLHFEPTAFEKGLALRLRGGARVVHADPLLVERIVRNLVSNAIRYTNDGSVLVACRARGDKVWVQVWDTGLGIRHEEQAKVFEEFYQVPNVAAVAPDQKKGLGLGLAIVKRLADLMGAPISMRSVPGKGTVFTLVLPVGTRPRTQATLLSGKGPVGITLDGRLIVVVEDEPAVRAGVEVLLKGWGATIVSFESVAEASAWAAASDAAQVRPDLLIVDYRLENGRTGVDAIVALRERFGAGVPAIVVTGSTMTGHDKEAQEKDFHILLKPVVPNKLRAMIAFKLGVKPGAAAS
jgi:signal transduction histidine kinase